MPNNDNDSDVMEQTKGGRRRSSSAPSSGKPSMMQMLWADLRKQPVPSEPSDEDLAYMEMEEAVRREQSEVLARAHSMDQNHVARMAQRYGTS